MRHRDNARFYDAAFGGANSITVATENPVGTSSFWLGTIHVDNRDQLMGKLLEQGIGASKVHALNDIHSVFAPFERPLPKCEEFNRTHLCIPVGWWVSNRIESAWRKPSSNSQDSILMRPVPATIGRYQISAVLSALREAGFVDQHENAVQIHLCATNDSFSTTAQSFWSQRR